MPNNVEHDLYVITDDDALLDEFDDFWNNHIDDISETLIPYPPEKDIIDKPMNEWAANNPTKDTSLWCLRENFVNWYNKGGYDWCVNNWGSNWGMYQMSKNDYCYTFETAWDTSLPLYTKLSERFPKIKFVFDYFECGMGFNGRYVLVNGRITEKYYSENYYGYRGG